MSITKRGEQDISLYMQSWVASNPLSRSSAYLIHSALMPSASWWCQGRHLRLLPHRGHQLCLLPRQGRQLCLLPHRGRQLRLLPRQGYQLRLLPRRGCQFCLLLCQLRKSKNILISGYNTSSFFIIPLVLVVDDSSMIFYFNL